MCHQDEILEYSTKRDVSLYQQTIDHSYIFTLHIPRLLLDYWKIVCSRLHIDWMSVLFVWWLHSPTIWRCPMFAGWICNLLNKEKARYIFFFSFPAHNWHAYAMFTYNVGVLSYAWYSELTIPSTVPMFWSIIKSYLSWSCVCKKMVNIRSMSYKQNRYTISTIRVKLMCI
jgi:hypothetical protein